MNDTSADSPLLFDLANGPDFTHEAALMRRRYATICGVDEAGRGPLAGPVTAAAVILDPKTIPDGLNDSKKLNERKREVLFEQILQTSLVSISQISASTIDAINIREASLLAMRNAINALPVICDFALIDGNALPRRLTCDAEALVKGDGRSLSIAAASIVAKVTRDRLMLKADMAYPAYGFAKHKGYPTKAHRESVMRHGPSPLHRLSFAPVAKALENRSQNKKPDIVCDAGLF